MFLPSYSPNLNLIERLWKFVKKEVLNSRHHQDFKRFQDAIDGCLADLPTKHREKLTTLDDPQLPDVGRCVTPERVKHNLLGFIGGSGQTDRADAVGEFGMAVFPDVSLQLLPVTAHIYLVAPRADPNHPTQRPHFRQGLRKLADRSDCRCNAANSIRCRACSR